MSHLPIPAIENIAHYFIVLTANDVVCLSSLPLLVRLRTSLFANTMYQVQQTVVGWCLLSFAKKDEPLFGALQIQ